MWTTNVSLESISAIFAWQPGLKAPSLCATRCTCAHFIPVEMALTAISPPFEEYHIAAALPLALSLTLDENNRTRLLLHEYPSFVHKYTSESHFNLVTYTVTLPGRGLLTYIY